MFYFRHVLNFKQYLVKSALKRLPTTLTKSFTKISPPNINDKIQNSDGMQKDPAQLFLLLHFSSFYLLYFECLSFLKLPLLQGRAGVLWEPSQPKMCFPRLMYCLLLLSPHLFFSFVRSFDLKQSPE